MAMELINVFDIMKMMSDFKYMHKYEKLWEVFYYSAVGMTMILISFPIKINTDDLVWSKIALEENKKSRSKINCGGINDKDSEVKRSLIEKPQNLTKSDNSVSYDTADGGVYI